MKRRPCWCSNILRSKRSRVCLLWVRKRAKKMGWRRRERTGKKQNLLSLSPSPLFLPFLQLSSIAQSETLEKQCTGSPVVNNIFFHYIGQAAGYPSEKVIKVPEQLHIGWSWAKEKIITVNEYLHYYYYLPSLTATKYWIHIFGVSVV